MSRSIKELSLKDKLKLLRKELKLSSAEFASLLNMSKSNYYKIERGEVKLSLDQIWMMYQKRQISPSQYLFLCGIPEMGNESSLSIKEMFIKLAKLYFQSSQNGGDRKFNPAEEEFMRRIVDGFGIQRSA